MISTIKMLLDNAYGRLNLLEFKYNHFDSLFQAEFKFKNSNLGGGKSSEHSWFPNKFDFISN